MIFFFYRTSDSNFYFYSNKIESWLYEFFLKPIKSSRQKLYFLFLALENPNKQVRVGFYAKQGFFLSNRLLAEKGADPPPVNHLSIKQHPLMF
jgi:hypothetical protein